MESGQYTLKIMHVRLEILFILTIGLSLACLFAYIAQRLRLSPIFGYLIAGYLIGPFSPGFVADLVISEQLAEIGVILMLFGVGMHFNLNDLVKVKNIAITGALTQTLIATVITMLLTYSIGWSVIAGAITGISVGVASTAVLVKNLTDNNLLNTVEGQIAIGWLVVEDIFTVVVLLLLPQVAALAQGNDFSVIDIGSSILFLLLKFAILITLMFTWGQRIVSSILTNIAELHSEEMFTLAVLALVFLIATGSAVIFGTSVPLGAFIAGMIIGKTNVKHQAATNALPLRDIFSIIFFLSIGMLFNPSIIFSHYPFFLGVLGVIILVKPLSAFLITVCMGYSKQIALTLGIALAQIGEFSFILAEEASRIKLLPDDGYDVIVACAIISILLNPILFQVSKKQRLHKI